MLEEIFAEVVDKNARVAENGRILGPQGQVLKDYTGVGVPAFMEFPHYQVAGWDEGFQCYFQRAVLRVDLPAPLARQQSGTLTITTAGEEARTESPYLPPRWAFAEQARGFVAAALGDGPQLSPANEAAKDVALAHELTVRRRGQV